jgi:hypothetical protein
MIILTVTYGRPLGGNMTVTFSAQSGSTILTSTPYTTTDINLPLKMISFGNYGYPLMELIAKKSGSIIAMERALFLDYRSLLPVRGGGVFSTSVRVATVYVGKTPSIGYQASIPVVYEDNESAFTTTFSMSQSVDTSIIVPPDDIVVTSTYLISRKLSDDNATYDRCAYFMGSSINMDDDPNNMIITSSQTERDEILKTTDPKLLDIYSDNDVNTKMLLVPRYLTTTSPSHVFVGTDTVGTSAHPTGIFLSSAFICCETTAASLQLSMTSGLPVSVPGGGVKLPGYSSTASPLSFTKRILEYGVDGSSPW